MSKTYVTLASIWTWLVLRSCIALWVPLMSIIWLVTWPFDRERYWVGLFFRKIAVVTATLSPLWHFRVTGTMPENPRRPYVVVSNHESFTDILLISHLPWEMKWLSKIEILRIPVQGWIMRIAREAIVLLDHYERLPRKSPTFAAVLSAIVPGSGYVYAGHVGDGLTAFFLMPFS